MILCACASEYLDDRYVTKAINSTTQKYRERETKKDVTGRCGITNTKWSQRESVAVVHLIEAKRSRCGETKGAKKRARWREREE